jgi:hypothetical protein
VSRATAAGGVSQHFVEGPAFPVSIRLLASVLVMGLAVSGLSLAAEGRWRELSSDGWILLTAALVVVGAGYCAILVSRTRIDGTHIRQSWLWRKEVALADITQLKLIQLPGLSWLVVPRLLVRARGMALPTTFQLGSAALVGACHRLAYGD